jgi:hypothetical protein
MDRLAYVLGGHHHGHSHGDDDHSHSHSHDHHDEEHVAAGQKPHQKVNFIHMYQEGRIII